MGELNNFFATLTWFRNLFCCSTESLKSFSIFETLLVKYSCNRSKRNFLQSKLSYLGTALIHLRGSREPVPQTFDLVIELLQPVASVTGDVVIGPRGLRVYAGLSHGAPEPWLPSFYKDIIIEVICAAWYHQLLPTVFQACTTLIEARLEERSEWSFLTLTHPSRVTRTVLDVVETEPFRDIVVETVWI